MWTVEYPLSGDCSSASIGSAFTLFFGNLFLHGDKMATIRPDIDPMPSVTPTGEMILSLLSPRKTSECIFLSLFLPVPSLKHHYSQLEENDLIVQAWVNCSSLEVMGKNSFQITGSKLGGDILSKIRVWCLEKKWWQAKTLDIQSLNLYLCNTAKFPKNRPCGNAK